MLFKDFLLVLLRLNSFVLEFNEVLTVLSCVIRRGAYVAQ